MAALHHVGAVAPGPVTPCKSDEAAGGSGFLGTGTADGSDCASATARRKPWVTVQAGVLVAGYRADLLEGDDGRPLLIISRWALTRSFTEVTDARAWLALVTGRAT